MAAFYVENSYGVFNKLKCLGCKPTSRLTFTYPHFYVDKNKAILGRTSPHDKQIPNKELMALKVL